MWLIREVTENIPSPVAPQGGWNVGHLANHGIILSCDGFQLKLDLEQLNAFFDLAEDGAAGEVRDTSGKAISVEVLPDSIVLARDGDDAYPSGVILDLDTLKEMGIEQHEAETEEGEQPGAERNQPAEGEDAAETDDTMKPEGEEDNLEEGVKRAYRRSGKKIKRGFRVTSGWRKGRVVASAKSAFKPRPKAKTRMKLRIAGRKKRIVKLLKARRTRRKSLSKRLKRMNATVK